MAILGKDLFEGESADFFEFPALFSNDGIEIGDHSYRYAEISTSFLNYDPSEYKKAMGVLKDAHGKGERMEYASASKEVNSLILEIPLYQGSTKAANLMADYGYEKTTGFLEFAQFLGEDIFITTSIIWNWRMFFTICCHGIK